MHKAGLIRPPHLLAPIDACHPKSSPKASVTLDKNHTKLANLDLVYDMTGPEEAITFIMQFVLHKGQESQVIWQGKASIGEEREPFKRLGGKLYVTAGDFRDFVLQWQPESALLTFPVTDDTPERQDLISNSDYYGLELLFTDKTLSQVDDSKQG